MAHAISFLIISVVALVSVAEALGPQSDPDVGSSPHTIIPLDREAVPVVKNGKTVSHKIAYHGKILIGSGPADQRQSFSVVFDTGSGHIVVPSKDCKDATCLKHRHYDVTKSTGAVPINADGSLVPDDELCDQVTIGYGTGTVLGELARESVCLGPAGVGGGFLAAKDDNRSCAKVSIVMAVEMSAEPFNSFSFDGVFGLGLDSLALMPEFSFVGQMMQTTEKTSKHKPQFAVFLSDGEDGQQSEIAFGGHDSKRLDGSLSWTSVTSPKLGYWQVKISSIQIGGTEFKSCKKGKCRAIVDTGTSHVGIPDQFSDTFQDAMTSLAGSTTDDCRAATAPNISITIDGFTLTIGPKDYMRPQPLMKRRNGKTKAIADSASKDLTPTCTPRIMPVSLKAPLGPNLFILGEPILRRYYTVFDREGPRIGFGLAKKKARVTMEAAMEVVEPLEPLDGEDDGLVAGESQNQQIYLMQFTLTVEVDDI